MNNGPVLTSFAAHDDFISGSAFEVLRPSEQRVPFVFNSPHSGADYPQRFLDMSQLDGWQIRRSEDCFVDALYQGVVGLGAPLLKAHFPRAYLDANRAPDELDPSLFSGPLHIHANAVSPRVVGGLGVIPRVVGEGRSIYSHKIPPEEALLRLQQCYVPYHAALRELIDETVARFGYAVLIDCHSMPGLVSNPEDGFLPDFIIGDRFGQSATPNLSATLLHLLRGRGYRVSHNRPYAGGFITEHFGQPSQNVHAIQIEMSRRLYMDEARFTPLRQFSSLQQQLTEIMDQLMAMPDCDFQSFPLAAE